MSLLGNRTITVDEKNFFEKQLIKLRSSKKQKSINKLRCAIYARKSQEDETNTSLPTQIKYCEELINTCDLLELKYTLSEDKVSGMFTDRDKYNELLNLIDNKLIDVVVIMRWDRLNRASHNCASILERARNNNVYILAGDSVCVLNSPSSIFTSQVLWCANELEARKYAESTTSTLIDAAKQGKYVCGRPPFGYKLNNLMKKGEIELDIEEAVIVSEIFNNAISGLSLQKIANDLNNKGIKTKRNNDFTKSSVKFIIENPIYYGKYVYNSKTKKKKKRKVIISEFEEVINYNIVPAIIDEETYLKANKAISNNKYYHNNNNNNYIYLLSGLINCKQCNRKMIGESNNGGNSKKNRHYYQCPNHKNHNCNTKAINADYIEKFVISIITKSLNSQYCHLKIKDVIKDKKKFYLKEIKLLNKAKKEYDSKIEQFCEVLAQTKNATDLVKTEIFKVMDLSIKKSKHLDKEIIMSNLDTLTKQSSITENELLENRIFTKKLCSYLIKEINVDENNDEIEIVFH